MCQMQRVSYCSVYDIPDWAAHQFNLIRIIFTLNINCRFSNISLDESMTPVEGTINACKVLQVDEEHLEAGYRVPEAPDVLQVARGDLFWSVQTLVSHCACVRFELYRCYPNLGAMGTYDKNVAQLVIVCLHPHQ